ncbi:MAG: Cdc6/Cdc18 family protein [Promethearchaeota archaeon]
MDETEKFDEIESIDEAADILGWTEERQVGVEYEIDPETEFWGHCSNLQAWYEHNYDTRLLHSNLSFPLLKKLAEVGDPIANRVFKEEIVKRLESGYPTVIKYIIEEKLLENLNREELRLIIDQGFFEPFDNYFDHDEGFFDTYEFLLKVSKRAGLLVLNIPHFLNYIDKLSDNKKYRAFTEILKIVEKDAVMIKKCYPDFLEFIEKLPGDGYYNAYCYLFDIIEKMGLFEDTQLEIQEKAKIIDLILNHPDKTRSIQILDKYTKSNELKEKYDVYLSLSKEYPENMLLKQQLRKKILFLQESSLDLNYIPDKLLCRDDAITKLIFIFRRILEESEQLSINCLILGKNGVGKTAIARFFGRNFRKIADEKGKEIIVEYFNCFYFRSMSKIIRELLPKHTHGSGRGLSNIETLKLILKQLIREERYMLLIIDEVHLLSHDDIFSFLAISESFGHQNAKISIILISRSKDWMRIETERILSRLNEKIKLKPYNYEESKQILEYRIELAFKKNVINEETLTFLSKIVYKNRSLSNGIRLLRQCGLIAEKEGLEHINMDIINTMSREMYPTFRIQIVEQLKDQELLTLFGIVHSLINREESYTLVDNAFEEYNIICETYNVKSHTKKTFRKYIQTLSKMRIISPRMRRIEETERGRHLEIFLIDIIPERFENLLINIFDKKLS